MHGFANGPERGVIGALPIPLEQFVPSTPSLPGDLWHMPQWAGFSLAGCGNDAGPGTLSAA